MFVDIDTNFRAADLPRSISRKYIEGIIKSRTSPSFTAGSLSLWDWNRNLCKMKELSELVSQIAPSRPLNVLILTSLREWGHPYMRNQIKKSMSPNPIMSVANATQPGRILDGIVKIAGVVYDDDAKDIDKYLLETNDAALTSLFGAQDVWSFPSSSFRRLPLSAKRARISEKKKYEELLAGHARDVDVDVICSVHYLNKIEFLSRMPTNAVPFGQYGRILNIHPGIIRPPSECCGYWHDMKAIFHYHGLKFDEHDPDIRKVNLLDSSPENFHDRFQEFLEIKRLHEQLHQVEPNSSVGATFHIVNSEFDKGNIISESRITEVSDSDTPWSLSERQMAQDENQALMRGLIHYAKNLYPLINLCSVIH